MKNKRPKTSFEFFLPIFNTDKNNLYNDDNAYYSIKNQENRSRRLLNLIELDKVYVVDYFRKQFQILDEVPIEKLAYDAKDLLEILKKEKNFKTYTFWGIRFGSRRLKKKEYLINSILEDKSLQEMYTILEIIIDQSEVIAQMEELGQIWDIQSMDFELLVEKYNFLKDISKYAREALDSYEQGVMALNRSLDDNGLLQFSYL